MTLSAPLCPLAVHYESAFLSHVHNGLGASRFLSSSEREPVNTLLQSGAPVGDVGDALFFAHGQAWARGLKRTHGAGLVSVEMHDARRLFEPIAGVEREPNALDASFLERLGGLSEVAGQVLEVRWPVYLSAAQIPLIFGLSVIKDVMTPLGFTVCEKDDESLIMRIPSLTLLERSAAYFFGEQAVAFCMAPGAVPKTDVNALHKNGRRAVGHPFVLKFADVSRTPPFGYTLHDAAHGLLMSRDVSVAKRRDGVALYEALEASGLVLQLERRFPNEMASLINLEVGGRILDEFRQSLRGSLPKKEYGRLAACYREKRKEAQGTTFRASVR